MWSAKLAKILRVTDNRYLIPNETRLIDMDFAEDKNLLTLTVSRKVWKQMMKHTKFLRKLSRNTCVFLRLNDGCKHTNYDDLTYSFALCCRGLFIEPQFRFSTYRFLFSSTHLLLCMCVCCERASIWHCFRNAFSENEKLPKTKTAILQAEFNENR